MKHKYTYILFKNEILILFSFPLAHSRAGLFHKAILHSGTITCQWAIISNQPEATSFKLASVLGNNSKDPEKVTEFLQTIPTAEIVKAQYKVLAPEVRITFHVLLFYFTSKN